MPMSWIDLLLLAIIATVLFLVIRYIRKAKKKGVACIGCPDSAACSGHCDGYCGHCSNCTCHSETEAS